MENEFVFPDGMEIIRIAARTLAKADGAAFL
jgi:hypothetical protein